VQLPSGEGSFLLQWQPCLNKMLRMYYFPWDQSDQCFLSVIMWWITVGTVTTLTPPCSVLNFWWRQSIGLTNKILKFDIQSLLLVLCVKLKLHFYLSVGLKCCQFHHRDPQINWIPCMQLCQLDSLTVFQLQFSCCNILALQTERDVDVVGN
jgi:hypothetical protein